MSERLRDQNVAAKFLIPLIDPTSRPDRKTSASISTGDVKVLRHTSGSYNVANITTLPTEVGSTGIYEVLLSATETNPDDTNFPITVTFASGTNDFDDNAFTFYVRPVGVNTLEINGGNLATNSANLKLNSFEINATSGVGLKIKGSAGNAGMEITGNTTGSALKIIGGNNSSPVKIDNGSGVTTHPTVYIDGKANSTDTTALFVDGGAGSDGILVSAGGSALNLSGGSADINASEIDQILTDIAALNNLSDTEVATLLTTALTVDTISELTQGTPVVEPSISNALMLVYMALRNKGTQTASEKAFFDNSGTKITKKIVTDDTTTYTESTMISGA